MRNRAIALLVCFLACALAAANPEGDALVAKIKALQQPTFDQAKTRDKAALDAFMGQHAAFTKERNALIWKLFLVDPKNPATADLMAERWERFEGGRVVVDEAYKQRLTADIEKALSMKPGPAITEAGKFSIASMKLGGWISDSADAIRVCDAFATEFPKSKRAPMLYLTASYSMAEDQRPPLFRAFLARFADHEFAPLLRGGLRQKDELGKPFALAFTDTITGKAFDIKENRGKVVLIDFWATWCGPCVDKIPELKKLNDTYGSQGLQIVGVSLDQPEKEGGLAKLKDFVAKNSLPWPQFYEGVPIAQSFAASWGVMTIPCVFLIDKSGLLRVVRPRDVEESIKRLLAEKQ